MYEELKEWSKKTGIFAVSKPEIDIGKITKCCNDINSVTIEELEDIIAKASSYNIYLESVKGAFIAQISYLSQELNKRLYLETKEIDKFTPKEEKVAIVLATFRDIAKMQDDLTDIKMKYMRIKDLPHRIEVAIHNMKMIYGRMVNERYKFGGRENAAVNNNQAS